MSLARPIDLRSALIGLGIAGSLVLLTSLAAPPQGKTVRITLDPDPSTIVRVNEGEIFEVPSNRRLVIKAFSGGDGITGGRIKINGAIVLSMGFSPSPPLLSLEFPLVAEAGDEVTIEEANPQPDLNTYVTGYLAP